MFDCQKWLTGEAIVICHMIMIGKRFFFRNRPYRKDGGIAIRNLDLKFMINEVSGAFSVNVFLAFVFPFAIMHQEGSKQRLIIREYTLHSQDVVLLHHTTHARQSSYGYELCIRHSHHFRSGSVLFLGQGILFNYLSLLCREIPYLDDLISAPKHVPTQPEGSYMKLYVCGMIFFLSAIISANYPLYLSYRYPAILGRIVGPYLVYLYESIKKSPAVYDGYTTSLSIVSSIGHLGVTVYILSNKPRSRNPFKLMMYYGITFIVEVTLSSIVLVAFQ